MNSIAIQENTMPREEARQISKSVRLSDEEFEVIEEAAKKSLITPITYIRQQAVQAAQKEKQAK